MKDHFSDARRIFATSISPWRWSLDDCAHEDIFFLRCRHRSHTLCTRTCPSARAFGPPPTRRTWTARWTVQFTHRVAGALVLQIGLDHRCWCTCDLPREQQQPDRPTRVDVITSPTRSTRSRGCRRQCNGHDVRRELRVFLLGSVRSIYCAAPVQRRRATKAALDSADRA